MVTSPTKNSIARYWLMRYHPTSIRTSWGQGPCLFFFFFLCFSTQPAAPKWLQKVCPESVRLSMLTYPSSPLSETYTTTTLFSSIVTHFTQQIMCYLILLFLCVFFLHRCCFDHKLFHPQVKVHIFLTFFYFETFQTYSTESRIRQIFNNI